MRIIDVEIAKKRLQSWVDESEMQGFKEAARNLRNCINLLDAVPTLTPPPITGDTSMERLTIRSGFTNEVYLTGKADTCWANRPIKDRAFCVGCHRHKGMDRTNCGALMLVDRLAAYEDTGLEPEEIIELKARMEGLEK